MYMLYLRSLLLQPMLTTSSLGHPSLTANDDTPFPFIRHLLQLVKDVFVT